MSPASRREFLRRAGAFSLLRAAAPLGLQLAGISAAAAASQPDDYRAIVCLFMYGANDGHNTVVPLDAEGYARYAAARTVITLPREDLLALPTAPAARPLGLHPALAPLQKLYQRGTAALLANVGPLVVPIKDAATFKNTTIARPPKLFSHNDQQAIWQSFSPEGAKIGWGGRIADLLAAQNGKHLFTAISAAGNAVFLASDKTIQYQISNSGAIGFNRLGATNIYGSAKGAEALRAQLSASQNDLFAQEYAAVVNRSMAAHGLVSSALAGLPETDPRIALPATLQQDKLAQQLRIVARMIGVRNDDNIQQHRQVFFVSLNGFDTHDHQLGKQAELLHSVAESVAYFQASMEALGVADKVTLFTASDFGRALLSNGDGSDHGWGNHHFIVGGAVRGGQVYGQFPDPGLNTGTDVGNGRLLPTTAVDQYAATLARWMGVRDGDLPQVLPNVTHFATSDLGFMGKA
ncbi:MAG: Tat pathway signal protein [Proteobacteria bacterium]|nr:Tat pathway signal protein [Pseudomonadota bacterium]